MRDRDIRTALHNRLSAEHGPGTQYVDELGICGAVRVDVAVLNGIFSGYELKSDRDTLRRLPVQVEVYSKVFDRATLVVGASHHAHARTLGFLPDWWGVIVASNTMNGVLLEEDRPSTWNEHVDPEALSQLLWRQEMLEELEMRGLEVGFKSKPRGVLAQVLARELPIDELRATVRHRLKTREGWRQLQQHV